MKTKIDLRALKSKHLLQLVMQDAGERFAVDKAKPELWRSTITPGLTVDISRQLYEITKPGMETESGDVFKWLQRRYSWTFGMAIKFLQNRTPDPKQKVQPAKGERKTQVIRNDEDKNKPLDKWQEEALQIAGERIREYFSWRWTNLVMQIPETRIEPTHAPEITHCGQCEKKIKWNFEKTLSRADIQGAACWKSEHIGPIPVTAYSIKRRMSVSIYGLEGSKELEAVFVEAKINKALREKIIWAIGNFEGLLNDVGALFVEDEDGVVCEKCAWKEFNFQRALVLCKTSARRRLDEELEEQRNIDQTKVIEVEDENIYE